MPRHDCHYLVAEYATLQAAFTFTTTHHAELKEEASTNPEWVSAAVEFDIETLRPRYKLVWGEVGASNALAVARTLGFDRTVVAEGERWKAKLASLALSPAKAKKMSKNLDVRSRSVADSVSNCLPIR